MALVTLFSLKYFLSASRIQSLSFLLPSWLFLLSFYPSWCLLSNLVMLECPRLQLLGPFFFIQAHYLHDLICSLGCKCHLLSDNSRSHSLQPSSPSWVKYPTACLTSAWISKRHLCHRSQQNSRFFFLNLVYRQRSQSWHLESSWWCLPSNCSGKNPRVSFDSYLSLMSGCWTMWLSLKYYQNLSARQLFGYSLGLSHDPPSFGLIS